MLWIKDILPSLIGGGVSGVCAVVFLSKKITSHWLMKEVEKYKNKLQRDVEVFKRVDEKSRSLLVRFIMNLIYW